MKTKLVIILSCLVVLTLSAEEEKIEEIVSIGSKIPQKKIEVNSTIDIIDKKFTRYFKNENREKELENLEWLQKQVTLLVEIRDAVAPQLEVAVKYIGNLFVTFPPKVVGKAIGLVGKGILQGLGRSSSK